MSISRSASSTFTSSLAEPPQTSFAAADEPEIIGSSAAIKRLRLQVQRIGPHFRTVLVRGEAGTEKVLVARALHELSAAADGPFVVGHAVTFEDALAKCETRTRASSCPTLFLDGVNEVLPEMQDRLLRWLKENESARSLNGLHRPAMRMISSTVEDLRVLVSTGRFRRELCQRLATVEIVVPPLRERKEDLLELSRCFLGKIALQDGRRVHEIADEAMERMQRYHWPGNVSELESVLRNSALQCNRDVLEPRHLPTLGEAEEPGRSCAGEGRSVLLQDVVEQHVLRVLKDCGGNKLRAAEMLGISRSTLYRMLHAGVPAGLSL